MQYRLINQRYLLQELLGRGGMGSVWRATDQKLQIDVAVKLIDAIDSVSDELKARFEREALASAQLRSANIVTITDHGFDEVPYIVMELLRGENLAARLSARERLPFDETLKILAQVANALAFAHELRIVHRDLKPDNVFIASERGKEIVKVLDFGVAKQLDDKSFDNKLRTHTGALIGTPYYMSPEQTRASSDIDHRSDIWAFGVMAYECLTGKRPFDSDTLPDLLMAICRDPVVPPSQVAPVPAGFDEWFARATEREVADRFQSIEDAMSALTALESAELVPAHTRADSNVGPLCEPAAESGREEFAPAITTMAASTATSPVAQKPSRRRALVLGTTMVVGIALCAAIIVPRILRSSAPKTREAPHASTPAIASPRTVAPQLEPGIIPDAGLASDAQPVSSGPQAVSSKDEAPSIPASANVRDGSTPPKPRATNLPGASQKRNTRNATYKTAPKFSGGF